MISVVSILLIVLGLSVLALTLFGLAKTTLVVSPSGGLLTTRVAQAIWTVFVRLSGNRRSSFLGPGILLAMLPVWLLFSWLGWTLLFTAKEGTVIESSSGRPADLAARVYFAGYSLITLGIGDYRPNPKGAFWQLATVVSAAQTPSAGGRSRLAVATLDEALTLFLLAVREEVRLDANVLRSARQAVGDFLDTLGTVHIEAAEVAPPPPSLRALHRAGIPTVTEEVFQGEVARLERRRLLLERDGWPWVTDEG